MSPRTSFELRITRADPDWDGTSVGFQLTPRDRSPEGTATTVRFHHRGWREENEHSRVSCYCWAMYLRILKRYLEHGERVPYSEWLDV